MSAVEDPEGHEHVGDEYVTYNRHRERRHRPDFPPFLLAQRKRKRQTKKQREGKSVRPNARQRDARRHI
jgi:hypothetical protein